MTDFLALSDLTLAYLFLLGWALDLWLIDRNRKPPCD